MALSGFGCGAQLNSHPATVINEIHSLLKRNDDNGRLCDASSVSQG
jgi:hypothetical protein